MFNKVILVGRLVEKVEAKKLSNGTYIANFTLTVPRRFKDEKGEVITDFFKCTTWKGNAENIAKFTDKGTKILVSGQLQNRCYEVNGEKRYYNEINVEEWEMTEKKIEEKVEKEKDDKCPF